MFFPGLIEQFLDDPGLKNDPKQRPIRLPLYQSCNFLSTDAASSCKLQFMLTIICIKLVLLLVFVLFTLNKYLNPWHFCS